MTGVSALTNSYSFSTCPNSSSTGVARPKIDTATFTRERASSISSTTPENEANGPSATRTFSPISNDTDAFLHLVQDAHGLILRDRHWLVLGAEEARDLRRVLDQMKRLVGQLHLHQHVAREELALGVDLAAAAHLGDLLGRHQHLLEQVFQPALLGLLADRFSHL